MANLNDTFNIPKPDTTPEKVQVDNKPKPAVQPVQPVVETQPPLREESTVLQMLSQEDAYIADVMRAQPKTIDEVLKVKEIHYRPGEHRLSLPKPFHSYGTRLDFRWVNKKKRAIDEAKLKGWVMVNRVLFPDIAKDHKSLFSTNGAVEKGDVVLTFISKERAAQIRRAPGKASSHALRNQLDKGKGDLPPGESGFYKPKTAATDAEDSRRESGGISVDF